MLDITWSPPYTVREGFATKWRREWCIPTAMLSGFFAFWKPNRFKMLAEGFTVIKSERTGKWYLYETKDNVALFKVFGEKPTKPEDKFVLPPYTIKDQSGLRTWQVDAAGKLCSAINHWGAAIDGSDTGCHAKGQLILMADGNTKKVEDIVVGDKVMGWQGPQTVTELKRGRQQMAKIIPVKGNSWTVNIDHILTVVLTNGCSPSHKITGGYKYGSIVDIKVKDWFNLPRPTKHAMKLFTTKVDTWPYKKLPFSPYFIGALLGDGGLSSKSMVSFTSNDDEVWNAIVDECKLFGWKRGDTNCLVTQRITNCPNLFKWLRSKRLLPISCDKRYVPIEYKTGDINQRLEILAGLIDTDGYYHDGNGYEITLKSKQLSDDVAFIARSVGLAAYTKPCKKQCCNNGVWGNYYRTHISGNVNIIPCRINRKIASLRTQKKNPLRTGFNIELLPEDDYYGFSLDGDGRFLLDNFVVTHNTGKTYTACAVARELGLKICVICPKAVIKSWNKVIKKHFGMGSSLIGVINYEKLRNGRKDSPIASYILHRHKKRPTFEWKLPAKTLIIWDESHKLKNWKTKNSKTCQAAIKAGYPMLFCSATNATNPLEMRAVGLALKLFNNSNSYYTWATENGVYKGQWGLEFNDDPQILKRLNKQIFDQRGVRLRRDDIPNFPKCEVIAEVYNMDDEDALKINETYAEMERELAKLAKLEKKDPTMEAVVQLRMRQRVELIKVPLFVEMIEEALEDGFSVAVFVNFTDTITAIANRLKIKCIFDGKTPDKVRERNVEMFQADSERVILVNIQSGGAGLSLHDLNGKFPRMSIISPTFSPIFMRQTLGRIWRDDAKTKSIQRIVCVANTVEENVCKNVQQKLNNLDLLNDGDLSYGKNYEIISD